MIVTMRTAALMALLTGSALLQGCSGAQGPAAAGSKMPVYAADVAGAAKACDAPNLTPVAGQTATVAIKVGNDGGWCGVLAHQEGSKPFGAGLLANRPAHGTVTIHTVGDNTRIDYVPDRAYAGADSFSVKLLPGPAVIQVTVTVTAPSA